MRLRHSTPADSAEIATLIHAALSTYYQTHLNDPKFGSDPAPFALFPQLYHALDPDCCMVAEDEASGALAGCAFYHPRKTHFGIGIVAAHPRFAGKGVARLLMEAVLSLADAAALPARLVSSAMNLASFSLYTRLGFVPYRTFQDITLRVPETGLPHPEPLPEWHVRPARASDLPAIVALEERLHGVSRLHDYAHFLRNTDGCWLLDVAEKEGTLVGFLGGVNHPGIRMLGPGASETQAPMAALIHAALNRDFRGQEVLWLVPVDAEVLVRQAYAWGGRNVELHLASMRGSLPNGTGSGGISLPTFMPESG
ncbi:MAG: hypothetical protein RLZZ244_1423 [Verrucomicrobiota bacterium]|jgi:GNAT superfamily N-acetyltransferase